MNRAEKRAQVKKLQKAVGISREDAIEAVRKYSQPKISLYEGTKVQINYDEIVSHPDWEKMNPKYKNFVETHKDGVYTVEYDATKKANNSSDKASLVCLAEDENSPKWLFFASDLIIADQTGAHIIKE